MQLQKIFFTAIAVVFFTACVNPGKEIKFNNNKVYFKDGATKEDGQKLGEYLVKTGYFDTTGQKGVDVQVLKNSNSFVVNFVVDTAAFKQHPEAYNTFKSFESEISKNVFGGGTVTIGVVDGELKEVKH